ncbi:hypothetical protein [Thermomonas brevis]
MSCWAWISRVLARTLRPSVQTHSASRATTPSATPAPMAARRIQSDSTDGCSSQRARKAARSAGVISAMPRRTAWNVASSPLRTAQCDCSVNSTNA